MHPGLRGEQLGRFLPLLVAHLLELRGSSVGISGELKGKIRRQRVMLEGEGGTHGKREGIGATKGKSENGHKTCR